MGIMKRLCLFVFSLAGLLALAALVLPWWGPWTREATALMGVDVYYYVVEGMAAVLAGGLLLFLLRSIFAQHRRPTVEVAREGSDHVSVTRDAIASQATHVIEEGDFLRAKRVDVRIGRRGKVSVAARVQPVHTVDVAQAGSDLHERLASGLRVVCGDNVDSIDLEFLDASEYQSEPELADARAIAAEPSLEPPAEPEPMGAVTVAKTDLGQDALAHRPADPTSADSGDTSEITVPMGRAAHGNEDAPSVPREG